jgi:hypothetical protein
LLQSTSSANNTSSFAFVEYESRRDADDAYHEMHNKRIGRDDLLKIEVCQKTSRKTYIVSNGITDTTQWARTPPSASWRFDAGTGRQVRDGPREGGRDGGREGGRRSPRRGRSGTPPRRSTRELSPRGDRYDDRRGDRRDRDRSRSPDDRDRDAKDVRDREEPRERDDDHERERDTEREAERDGERDVERDERDVEPNGTNGTDHKGNLSPPL